MNAPKLLTICAGILLLCACSGAPEQDLVLQYDAPAQYFEQSIVIGNGTLGAIIYGGVETNKIALNDITLWTGQSEGEPTNPDAYKHLATVRADLDREDYVAAERDYYLIQGHDGQYYQPLSTLYLNSEQSTYSTYERHLDISTAIAGDSYSGGFRREYFASAPDSVIVIRLNAEGTVFNTDLQVESEQPHETLSQMDGRAAEIVMDGYTAYGFDPALDGHREGFLYDPAKGIHFETIVRVEARDGVVRATDGAIQLRDCSEAVVYVSNVTSYNGPWCDPVSEGRDYRRDVRARIDRASRVGYEALKRAHIEDYTSLFDRVSLDLGTTAQELKTLPTDQQLLAYGDEHQTNPDLEELYFQYGRYLLISCSRTPGVPANLQGLWNEKVLAPWRSNYTMNINLEENYWPAEVGALPEMHMPLMEFIRRLSVSGHSTASNYYGVSEGWSADHNGDIWMMTNPVTGLPQWACWPMAGAWLSTHIWEHYCFTMDRDFLEDMYPVLKGAAEFCMGWLIEKDGYLMTSPSTSPEANFICPQGVGVGTLYGGTADLAFTRECLLDARAAAQVIGVEEAPLCERIDSTLSRLLPYHIGSRGNLQEWYYDWPDEDWHHRHQSHLVGLYPGHHLSVDETPELAQACARTLEIKGDRTTGWSTGWRVNLQARLRDAERAYNTYRTLLKYVSPDEYQGEDARRGGGTYPNLLDAHSPFQIDGNFGGCAGVLEMLVQSSMTVNGPVSTGAESSLQESGSAGARIQQEVCSVRLLPALPEAWSAQGSLKGVRVRGGYALDLEWRDGRVTALTVHSLRPDRGTLHLTDGSRCWDVTLSPGKSKKIKV